jgi:hypothetical protein
VEGDVRKLPSKITKNGSEMAGRRTAIGT